MGIRDLHSLFEMPPVSAEQREWSFLSKWTPYAYPAGKYIPEHPIQSLLFFIESCRNTLSKSLLKIAKQPLSVKLRFKDGRV